MAEYSNTEKKIFKKTYCGSTFALNNYSCKDISIKKKLFHYRQFRISKIILKQIRYNYTNTIVYQKVNCVYIKNDFLKGECRSRVRKN